jgi:hypothetical protein
MKDYVFDLIKSEKEFSWNDFYESTEDQRQLGTQVLTTSRFSEVHVQGHANDWLIISLDL